MINKKEYQAACKDYENNWALLNDTLYGLCRNNPGHSSLSVINAKFYIIGRTYAAGIERIRRKSDDENADLRDLVKHIYRNRQSVDPILECLSKIKEPLTSESLKTIIVAHGVFLNLLKKGLGGRAPRSFASKYLHFHCPVVPIFDSIASKELSYGQRWNMAFELFAIPKGADRDYYYRFAMRFWRHYNDATEKGLEPTARLIDNYLLWMAESRRVG